MARHEIAKKIEPSSKYSRFFFFWSGIVATIAYRIIFLLNSFWIQVAWYTGTIGFILYFYHRSMVETKRANLVKEYELIKVVEQSDMETEKKEALSYLIETSLTSKARFNSLFIFFASVIALIISLVIDIYKSILY